MEQENVKKEIEKKMLELLDKHDNNWNLALDEGFIWVLENPHTDSFLWYFFRPAIEQELGSILLEVCQKRRLKNE